MRKGGLILLPFHFWRIDIIKILGIDQATKVSGWALVEGGSLSGHGVIDLSKNTDVTERFPRMCKAIHDLIVTHNPEHVIIEGVSLQNNAAILSLLAQIQGAIIQTCVLCNIPFYIYPASSWRKDLGFHQGKGVKRDDLKRQAIQFVESTYNISVLDDEAEAICIATAFQKINEENT